MNKLFKIGLSLFLILIMTVSVFSGCSSNVSHKEKEITKSHEITLPKETEDIISGSFSKASGYYSFNKKTGVFTIDCSGLLFTDFADVDSDGAVTYDTYNYEEHKEGKKLDGTKVKSVVFDDGVTVIGPNPICYFKNLKKVTLPKSTRRILRDCFPNTIELDTVVFDGTKEEWNNIMIDDLNNDALLNCKNIEFTGNQKNLAANDYEGKHYETCYFKDGKVTAKLDYFTGVTIVSGKGRTDNRNDSDSKSIGYCMAGSPEDGTIPRTTDTLVYKEGITVITYKNAAGTGMRKLYLPKTIKRIKENAFKSNDDLTDVYYAGTKSQWNKIKIDSGNEQFDYVTMHFGVDYEM